VTEQKLGKVDRDGVEWNLMTRHLRVLLGKGCETVDKYTLAFGDEVDIDKSTPCRGQPCFEIVGALPRGTGQIYFVGKRFYCLGLSNVPR